MLTRNKKVLRPCEGGGGAASLARSRLDRRRERTSSDFRCKRHYPISKRPRKSRAGSDPAHPPTDMQSAPMSPWRDGACRNPLHLTEPTRPVVRPGQCVSEACRLICESALEASRLDSRALRRCGRCGCCCGRWLLGRCGRIISQVHADAERVPGRGGFQSDSKRLAPLPNASPDR